MEQQIKSYKRSTRQEHSGGRPSGDTGSVMRETFTTTLPVHVKKRLKQIAKQAGCPISDVISTLVFTLVEAQHHPGTPHHEMVQQLLDGGDVVSGRVGPDSDAWRRQAINSELIKQGRPPEPYWEAGKRTTTSRPSTASSTERPAP